MKSLIRRLLAEPLCQFVILGALIFLGYNLVSDEAGSRPGAIIVTRGKIENLAATFAATRQRPPTQEELIGLIQDYIREEVYYREAMALGLDRDDTIIRRRLRQKMEFIAADMAAQTEPTDAELQVYLTAQAGSFAIEPRFSFRQVYLNPNRRDGTLKQDALRLLAELNKSGAKADFQQLGDATLLSPEFADVRVTEVTAQFGEDFTRQLAQLPTGRWHGPVTSGYGVHLVFVDERKPERMPELREVRDQVHREWNNARQADASEKFYQQLRKRFAVTVE